MKKRWFAILVAVAIIWLPGEAGTQDNRPPGYADIIIETDSSDPTQVTVTIASVEYPASGLPANRGRIRCGRRNTDRCRPNSQITWSILNLHTSRVRVELTDWTPERPIRLGDDLVRRIGANSRRRIRGIVDDAADPELYKYHIVVYTGEVGSTDEIGRLDPRLDIDN